VVATNTSHSAPLTSGGTDIPTDVLCCIAEYLQTPERVRLTLLSKGFKNALDSPVFWRALDLAVYGRGSTDYKSSTFVKSILSHDRFKLLKAIKFPAMKMSAKLFGGLFQVCPHITSLDVTNLSAFK
jgi:hypothetical protein